MPSHHEGSLSPPADHKLLDDGDHTSLTAVLPTLSMGDAHFSAGERKPLPTQGFVLEFECMVQSKLLRNCLLNEKTGGFL